MIHKLPRWYPIEPPSLGARRTRYGYKRRRAYRVRSIRVVAQLGGVPRSDYALTILELQQRFGTGEACRAEVANVENWSVRCDRTGSRPRPLADGKEGVKVRVRQRTSGKTPAETRSPPSTARIDASVCSSSPMPSSVAQSATNVQHVAVMA